MIYFLLSESWAGESGPSVIWSFLVLLMQSGSWRFIELGSGCVLAAPDPVTPAQWERGEAWAALWEQMAARGLSRQF